MGNFSIKLRLYGSINILFCDTLFNRFCLNLLFLQIIKSHQKIRTQIKLVIYTAKEFVSISEQLCNPNQPY
jgi:hypothetical protein